MTWRISAIIIVMLLIAISLITVNLTYAFFLKGSGTNIPGNIPGNLEFNGPFSTWTNVKTTYGAIGNGVADDTAAIQSGVSALSAGTITTLYFPAGTYIVNANVFYGDTADSNCFSGAASAGAIYENIIGEDPSTTIIKAGSSFPTGGAYPTGGAMFCINGMAYSNFSRLTLDGNGIAGRGISQSWGGVGQYFDTGNVYSDLVLKNLGIAFVCGDTNHGCAETSMIRSKFLNNSDTAIFLGNANALDMFVWNSLFQNNAKGLTNFSVMDGVGGGNFHVFQSVFANSSVADMAIANTGSFVAQDNYSSGSNRFFRAVGTANAAPTTILRNTVVDTIQPDTVAIGNFGPVVAIDNVIRSGVLVSSGPVITVSEDLLSMGNTFTATSPTSTSGHSHVVNDQIVSRGSINPVVPTLPPTPPNNHRTTFEVTPGMNAAQIQTVINNAAACGTPKCVVHIQPATYSLMATITLPANSDMQIVGDGHKSRLAANGANPVLRVLGPSQVYLYNFSVNGNGNTADGIEVTNADQVGSNIYIESTYLSLSTTNFFADGLDRTVIEGHDFYHDQDGGSGHHSVEILGGASAGAGTWLGGAVNLFSGATSGNYYDYSVSNGAHLLVGPGFEDAASGASIATAVVTDASVFTMGGIELNAPGIPPAFSFNNFHGTAALVGFQTTGTIAITGDGTGAQVLAAGLVGAAASYFSNSSSPAATTQFLNGLTTFMPPMGTGATEVAEIGDANPTFLTATLAQIRTTKPTVPRPGPLSAGVTNVGISRLFVDSANYGIHILH